MASLVFLWAMMFVIVLSLSPQTEEGSFTAKQAIARRMEQLRKGNRELGNGK